MKRASRLNLVPLTRDQTLAMVDAMEPAARAEVSAEWLTRVRAMPAMRDPADPWTFGFSLMLRETGDAVGSCGFKGPPDADGAVEIAYGVDAPHRGKGYATEAAAAMVELAFAHAAGVRIVRAHTLPQPSTSTRVLQKCGFAHVDDAVDPDDGPVWRWELLRPGEGSGA